MAGLLGYAAAGALAGYGKGLVDDAVAKRDAALQALRDQREEQRYQRGLEAEDRRFERQQTMEQQRADARLKQDELQFQRTETAADRRAREAAEREAKKPGDRFQDEQGNWFELGGRGEPARPIMGPDGKPLKGPLKPTSDGGGMTASQRNVAIRSALTTNTTEDFRGNKAVNWQGFVGDLQMSNIPIDDSVKQRVRTGLEQELKPIVERDAERTGGLLKTKYDGKTKDEWVTAEMQKRIDKRMQELGLVDDPDETAPAAAPTPQPAPSPAPSQSRGGLMPQQAAPAPAEAQAPRMSPEQTAAALQRARDAIARGAPRAEVEKRLRANGIDPTGL